MSIIQHRNAAIISAGLGVSDAYSCIGNETKTCGFCKCRDTEPDSVYIAMKKLLADTSGIYNVKAEQVVFILMMWAEMVSYTPRQCRGNKCLLCLVVKNHANKSMPWQEYCDYAAKTINESWRNDRMAMRKKLVMLLATGKITIQLVKDNGGEQMLYHIVMGCKLS